MGDKGKMLESGRHSFATPVRALHFQQHSELQEEAEKQAELALSASAILHEREQLSPIIIRRRGSAQVGLSDGPGSVEQTEERLSTLEDSAPKPWYKPLTPDQAEASEQLNLRLLQTLKALEAEVPCYSLRETLCQKPTVSMRKPRKSNLMSRRSVGF